MSSNGVAVDEMSWQPSHKGHYSLVDTDRSTVEIARRCEKTVLGLGTRLVSWATRPSINFVLLCNSENKHKNSG